MYSTVEDLLKWDQALYTEKLLPAAAKQLMWTPFKDNYAYGWIIAPPAPNLFGGHKRQAHSGGINGFSSVIIRLPEPNVTVIVLANTDAANSSQIGRDIAAIYYGQAYTVPANGAK
jgi:CubicO group peptidase (beta-lactamase class C family)